MLWVGIQTLHGIREDSMVRNIFPHFESLKAKLQAFIWAILEGIIFPMSAEDNLVALDWSLTPP